MPPVRPADCPPGPASDVQVVFVGRGVGREATAAVIATYRGRPFATVNVASEIPRSVFFERVPDA